MDNFQNMLDKTMQLLSISSVEDVASDSSPFGDGVGACLNIVEDTAHVMGFSTHNEGGYYVTATIGEGEEFGILGHVDVVPFAAGWSASPLGEIKNDIIFGRGILDDKGPMISCLYACDELIKSGKTPTKKIKFIFGGNEESGWRCIEKYNQVDIMPKRGFSPDGDFPVINCEKGLTNYVIKLDLPKSLHSIAGGTRPNIVMETCVAEIDGAIITPCYDDNLRIEVVGNKTIITAQGTPAHGSTPDKGDNALWHILNFLAQTRGGEYKKLALLLCHNDGSGVNLKLSDEKSGSLTFNVGIIKTSVAKSGGKASLEITVDIRFPISFDKNEICDTLQKQFSTQNVAITHFHDPHYVDPQNELVTKLLSAYEEVIGEKAQPLAIGGGTYARALECGVAFGPMFAWQEDTIHQKNEHCSVADFKKMYAIYKRAIEMLCFE